MFKKLISEARQILEGGGSRLSKSRRQAAFRNITKIPSHYGKDLSGHEMQLNPDHNDQYERGVALHRKFTNGPGNGDRDRLAQRRPGTFSSYNNRRDKRVPGDFWARPKLP